MIDKALMIPLRYKITSRFSSCQFLHAVSIDSTFVLPCVSARSPVICCISKLGMAFFVCNCIVSKLLTLNNKFNNIED